jgi:hypothetical protein
VRGFLYSIVLYLVESFINLIVMSLIEIAYLIVLLVIIALNLYAAIRRKHGFLKKTFFWSAGTIVLLLTISENAITVETLERMGIREIAFELSLALMILLPLLILAVNQMALRLGR